MPTLDRKPRRRKANEPVESLDALEEQARQAKGDVRVWDAGLRRRMVRALLARGIKLEHAEGIARAYERRPELIPMRPPVGHSSASGADDD